jgi:hypothetical protein
LTKPEIRQIAASLVTEDMFNRPRKGTSKIRGIKMKSRWQKSLEAAVAAYDTPMPWARGQMRNEMIARRKQKAESGQKLRLVSARRA